MRELIVRSHRKLALQVRRLRPPLHVMHIPGQYLKASFPLQENRFRCFCFADVAI